MKFVKTMSILSSLLWLSLSQPAAGLDGKALYTAKKCHTCHGADGSKPLVPTYPKIAGQNAPYLEAQMKDIRDGKRNNGLSVAMKPFTMGLTDAEIKAIAKFLNGVKK